MGAACNGSGTVTQCSETLRRLSLESELGETVSIIGGMNMDLSSARSALVLESRELLAAMERALLEIEADGLSLERVNAAFRCRPYDQGFGGAFFFRSDRQLHPCHGERAGTGCAAKRSVSTVNGFSVLLLLPVTTSRSWSMRSRSVVKNKTPTRSGEERCSTPCRDSLIRRFCRKGHRCR